MNQADNAPVLAARRIPFEFPEDIERNWIPGEPELSAMMIGASLTMPYLEPFLMRTMREAIEQVDDAQLREDGLGFIGQEGQHYRAHRRFNETIKAKGYAELAAIEAQMEASYARLSQRSLQVRLAYTAGFESMTMGVTRWLVEDRVRLFANGDPRVVSMVLWHMVEETEHKRVAYDVYQALFSGGLRGYWYRMVGVFHGSLDVMRYSMKGYKALLKKDGLWRSPRSRLRLVRRLWWFVRNVGPYLLRAALPGHNPRQERDPQWVQDWLAGYARAYGEPVAGNADAVPMVPIVDTHDPRMPVPFPVHGLRSAA